METPLIKHATCSQSKQIVVLRLQCTSTEAARAIFQGVAAIINGGNGEKIVASLLPCHSDNQAARP